MVDDEMFEIVLDKSDDENECALKKTKPEEVASLTPDQIRRQLNN